MSAVPLTSEGIPVDIAVAIARLTFSAIDCGDFDPAKGDDDSRLCALIAKHNHHRRELVSLIAALQARTTHHAA